MGTSRINWQVQLINPNDCDTVWERVLQLLDKGQNSWQDYMSVEDIKREVSSGAQQLWLLLVDNEYKAVLLTDFVFFPRAKVLRILHVSGSDVIKQDLLEKLKVVMSWGKRQGANMCQLFGTPAWNRLLSVKEGFKFEVVLCRNIGDL